MSLKKNIIAFIIIGIAGTMGHFLYKWSGSNYAVGLFFPVNESTWEHLKLLFFPTLLYSIVEYISINDKPKNYFPTTALSVWCGMLTIVALFYSISGIIGYNIDFINIVIFFISIIVMLSKKQKIIKSGKFTSKTAFWTSIIFLTVTAVLFIIWSYNPPSYGIFTPPMIN